MPVARDRSRIDAPSYPFSQKMRAACFNTSARRRSKRVSRSSSAALRPFKLRRGLRPLTAAPSARDSGRAIGMFLNSYRTFVRSPLLCRNAARASIFLPAINAELRAFADVVAVVFLGAHDPLDPVFCRPGPTEDRSAGRYARVRDSDGETVEAVCINLPVPDALRHGTSRFTLVPGSRETGSGPPVLRSRKDPDRPNPHRPIVHLTQIRSIDQQNACRLLAVASYLSPLYGTAPRSRRSTATMKPL